jgi:transposase
VRTVAEGKSRREIIRCLKRYAAREIYRLLNAGRPGAVQGPMGQDAQ